MWGPVRHRGWRAFKIERISGTDLSAVVYQTAPTFAHARPDCADAAERAGLTEQSQKGYAHAHVSFSAAPLPSE